MNKIIKRGLILVLTALIAFGITPASVAYAADKTPVHTSISTSGKGDSLSVTYKLDLDKISVTDGRVAIFYDPEVFVLKEDSEKIKFSDIDVNKDYTEGEEKGISIAFVNDEAKQVSGNLVTLKFGVNKGLPAGESVIKTYIYTIDNESEVIISDETLEDSVNVGRGKLSKPNLTALEQTLIGVNVKWEKDPNADGYIVYRSSSKDSGYYEIANVKGSSFWDFLVLNNHTYFYKIRSYQGDGKDRVYSEYSDVLNIKVRKFKFW